MAKIEWVRQRIYNWVLWRVQGASVGSGWPSRSVLLSIAVDKSRESFVPVDSVEAIKTDSAIEAIRAGRPHLYEVIQAHYIRGLGIRQSAQALGKSESTVKANLDQIDHALQAWFGAEADKIKAKAPGKF